MRIVLATGNEGKIREISALCRGLPVELARASGVPAAEPGDSFEANALEKAEAVARHTRGWALADDSGLVVDALGGLPGVRSARWSGGGTAENNALLLTELSGVPPERRSAAFRCALALCHANGDALLVTGECRGRIAMAPRGAEGFGYDPLFEVPELGFRTFAEASTEEKARLSHRARAFAKLVPILIRLAG